MASNTMPAGLVPRFHSQNGHRFSCCDSDKNNGDYSQKQWQPNSQACSVAGSVDSKNFEREKGFYRNAVNLKERQGKRGLLGTKTKEKMDNVKKMTTC